jgi:hypothetical protein
MHFAIKCLIGMAVFASPCAYDTDPREPAAVAAIITKAPPAGGPPKLAAAVTHSSRNFRH